MKPPRENLANRPFSTVAFPLLCSAGRQYLLPGLLLATALLASGAAAAAGWIGTNPMSATRQFHTGTLLQNGSVLVAGGYASPLSGRLNSAEVYDPLTETWSAAGTMAYGRAAHTATLLMDGKVLVAGGGSNATSSLATELHDPATNGWTSVGNLSSPRVGHTATRLQNGKVLVTGGSYTTSGADLYDPATQTWSAAGTMNSKHIWHAATLLPDGRVLVAGGINSGGSEVSVAEIYDPASNAWSLAAPMGTPRSYQTATLLANGKILVVGGLYQHAELNTTELYDPQTNQWSAAAPVGNPFAAHTATLLPNGNVLVAGDVYTSSTWVYDVPGDSWSSAGTVTTGDSPIAQLLPTGKVLLTGGRTPGGNLATARLYDFRPVLALSALPDGKSGVAYHQTLTASGGTAPYGFALASGALPAGLSLASDGTLAGTPTVPGSFTFSIAATDSTGAPLYGPYTGSRSYTLTIATADQSPLTVSASPATIAYNGISNLSTSGGSGTGAVSYAVTSGAAYCSLSGPVLTGTGVGTCTVTATKAGDANYSAASATVDVTVIKANQALLTASASPTTIAYHDTSNLGTSGGSGNGSVSYAVTVGAANCSVSGAVLTGTGIGNCTVTATRAGDANYNAASATVDVTVVVANQAAFTVTASPATIAYQNTSNLGSSGGSGNGTVSYAVTSGAANCSLSGAVLTGTGVGSCTVTATKAADANYYAASATVAVTIIKANQAAFTVTASPTSIPYHGTSNLGTSGGSGSGAVSYAVTSGAANCSPAGAVVTGTAVGSCTITATRAGDANYNAASATVDVTVIPAAQAAFAVSASPATIGYNGTSNLSTTGGSGNGTVSFAVTSGAASCSLNGAVLTGTGAGSCTVTATKAADANYSATSATVDVTVTKVNQAVLTAAASPATIAYNGTSSVGATGGSGTGSVSYAVTSGLGNCAISGTTVTGTAIGSCTVTATRAADNNYNAAAATVDITVTKADQTALVAAASPATIPYNGTSTLGITGGSGTGPVTYVVTNGAANCSLNNTVLTGTAVGSCTVTATKAADTNYNVATAIVDVTVTKAGQAAFAVSASPSTIAYNGTSIVGNTGGSGTGAVSYVVTGGAANCSISGTTLTGIGVGSCTVTATKAADGNYNVATATVDVSVTKTGQAAFAVSASPSSIPYNGTSILGSTGGSGTGAVSYLVTSGAANCSINGTTLTGTGVGNCTVTATKAADSNYNVATATVDVSVTKANQAALTLSASPPAIPLHGNSTLAVSGGSGSGAVSYAVTAGSKACSISGASLVGNHAGICTVTATKAPDADYADAAVAKVDVTVNQAGQVITFGAAPSVRVGGTGNVSATADSGLPVILVSLTPAICAIAERAVTGLRGGDCTIQASQGGDADHRAATPVTQSFPIAAVAVPLLAPWAFFGVGAGLTLLAARRLRRDANAVWS